MNTDTTTGGREQEPSDDQRGHTSRHDCAESESYVERGRVHDPAGCEAGWTGDVAECSVCGRERVAYHDDETGELREVEYRRPDGTVEYTDRHY